MPPRVREGPLLLSLTIGALTGRRMGYTMGHVPRADRLPHRANAPGGSTRSRTHGVEGGTPPIGRSAMSHATAACRTFILAITLTAACSVDSGYADPPPLLGNPASLDEQVGLFPSSSFSLTTGQCTGCRTPEQARWYFQHDVIAIPTADLHQQDSPASPTQPFLVWIGSPEIIERASLTPDRHHLQLVEPDRSVPIQIEAKLASNRSYYSDATAEFFAQRSLRIRGKTVQRTEGPAFMARMIWPSDYRLDRATALYGASPQLPSLADLIEAEKGGANTPYRTHLIWEQPESGTHTWAGKPVLALMLNGAQGDDDEAHGGHFGIVTGRVGPHGEWADWLMNNFYDLNVVSEKGILPAMLPLDQYLMDLNSGQAYYRPSYLLTFVLKQDRIPVSFQTAAIHTLSQLYRHEIEYDHSTLNCAGLSLDILRGIGWQVPQQGPTSRLKATGGFIYVAATERSLASGRKLYDYFSEERTRLLPRVTFEAIGSDAIALITSPAAIAPRPLTEMERWLQEDVEAIVLVRIPQIPSSRPFGAAPVASLDEYQRRVPADRSQWKTIAVPPRPFPNELRVRPAPVEVTMIPGPVLAVLGLVLTILAGIGWMLYRRITCRMQEAD